MARFRIEIREDSSLRIGASWDGQRLAIDEVDEFVTAVQAAKAFARANADVQSSRQDKEPVTEPEAAE